MSFRLELGKPYLLSIREVGILKIYIDENGYVKIHGNAFFKLLDAICKKLNTKYEVEMIKT